MVVGLGPEHFFFPLGSEKPPSPPQRVYTLSPTFSIWNTFLTPGVPVAFNACSRPRRSLSNPTSLLPCDASLVLCMLNQPGQDAPLRFAKKTRPFRSEHRSPFTDPEISRSSSTLILILCCFEIDAKRGCLWLSLAVHTPSDHISARILESPADYPFFAPSPIPLHFTFPFRVTWR